MNKVAAMKAQDSATAEGLTPRYDDPRVDGRYFEQLFHAAPIARDPMFNVIQIPRDAIAVEDVVRFRRTSESPIPQSILSNIDNLDAHVRDCLYIYTKDWKRVVAKYRDSGPWGGRQALPLSDWRNATILPSLEFSCDIAAGSQASLGDLFRESSQHTTTPDKELLLPYGSQIKEKEAKLRTVDRVALFKVLDINPKYLIGSTDLRPLGSPYDEKDSSLAIRIRLKDLTFQLGDVEPFFVSISLLDIKNRRRVSETFHTTVSNKQKIGAIHHTPGPAVLETSGRECIFRVSRPSADIHLVVRVEKVLKGDSDSATMPYFQHFKLKPKDKQKFEAEMVEASLRLGKYRQPFGVTLMPLFNDKGALINTGINTLSNIVRHHGDLTDAYVCEKAASIIASKGDVYPGRCLLEVARLDHNAPPTGRIDPSYVPVLPVAQGTTATQLIRETDEFVTEDEDDLVAPCLSYYNRLYVYPDQCDLRTIRGISGNNARNLSLDISFKQSDQDPKSPGSMVIYGGAFESSMKAVYTTPVQYHERRFGMYDEVRIELPARVPPKSHIMFTCSHITCQAPKKSVKSPKPAAVTLAQGALRLIVDGSKFIDDDEHSFPFVLEYPPSYFLPNVEDGFKYADKQRKPNINVRTKLLSSILTTDASVGNFFSTYDNTTDGKQMAKAIDCLQNGSLRATVSFFPVLMTELFQLICTPKDDVAKKALLATSHLVQKVSTVRVKSDKSSGSSHRHPHLVSYVNYVHENVFVDAPATPSGSSTPTSARTRRYHLFEGLTERLYVVLQEKHHRETNIVYEFLWFYFDVIVRSITLYVHEAGVLGKHTSRLELFEQTFCESLSNLCDTVVDRILHTLHSQTPELSASVAEYLAYFLKDLLDVMERGTLFAIMNKVCTRLEEDRTNPSTQIMFSFLRIILGYEHYVSLNLPLRHRISNVVEISKQFWKKHFLSGLLLHEIAATYRIFKSKTHSQLRIRGVKVLYHLLLKHDIDPRYQEPLQRERLADMYFPYILLLIDAEITDRTISLSSSPEEKSLALACFLHIVKNGSSDLLQEWWRKDSQKRVMGFFSLLSECVETFAYASVQDTTNGEPKRPRKRTANYIAEEADKLTEGVRGGAVSAFETVAVRNSPTRRPVGQTPTTPTQSPEQQRAGNTSTETTMVVLDILMAFMQDFHEELNMPGDSVLLEHVVIEILVRLLSTNQSTRAHRSVFACVRHVLYCYTGPVFKYVTSCCGELAYELLRLCNAHHPETRNQASALIYLMIQINYIVAKNFLRMKLQSTIAVSKLVGEGITEDPTRFRSALEAVVVQARSNPKMPSTFSAQVKQLVERLFTVLRNSVKISQYSYDPEMTADLYHAISIGYHDSPDLQAAWLANLGVWHEKRGNLLCAAQCKLQLAALVTVYNNHIKKDTEGVPVDKIGFLRTSPNIAPYLKIPSDTDKEEGICESKLFTRRGLNEQLGGAVLLLKQHYLYELCVEVLRLRVTIHQKTRTYDKLADEYEELYRYCGEIVKANKGNSRLFTTYYRVGFYGSVLPEMDQKQFVYQEEPGIRVGDLTVRLKEQYEVKLGDDNVVIVGGQTLDVDNLDPKKLYIQVTSVLPYFEEEELDKRVTPFQKNFDLNKFIFETPFTKSGKKRSEDMTEQWKLKTILVTARPFPFVVKRIPITERKEIELSPIENAVEMIADRCQKLRAEVNAHPPTLNALQIVLQGSVLLQVNAGPLEICRLFLGSPDSFDPREIEKLRDLMDEFVRLCHDALVLNKSMIDTDQLLFQAELQKGYIKVKEHVQKFVGRQIDDSSATPRFKAQLSFGQLTSSVDALGNKSKGRALPTPPSNDSPTRKTAGTGLRLRNTAAGIGNIFKKESSSKNG